MHSDKGMGVITFLCLLGIWLGVVTPAAFAASGPAAAPGKAKGILRVLDPVGVLSASEATIPPAPRLKELSGKKVWIVVAGGRHPGHAYWMQASQGLKPVSAVVHLPEKWRDLIAEAEKELGPIP